jgi:hypothetical protein
MMRKLFFLAAAGACVLGVAWVRRGAPGRARARPGLFQTRTWAGDMSDSEEEWVRSLFA